MSWFVYIIQNQDGILYTGITVDPSRRIKEHNGLARSGAKATRMGRPWTFVYLEGVPSNNHALRKEYAIKRLSRAKKLLLLQAHDLIEQTLLSERERRDGAHHVVEAHQVGTPALSVET